MYHGSKWQAAASKWQAAGESMDDRFKDKGFNEGISGLIRLNQERADEYSHEAAKLLVFGLSCFGLGTAMEFGKLKPFTRRVFSTIRDYTSSDSEDRPANRD
jgi:hypothetical protein